MAGRQYLDNHLSNYIKGIGHLFNTESPVIFNTRLELTNRKCYYDFVDTFHKQCFNIAHVSIVTSKYKIIF